ncbi:hypothetical protein BC830DRAFT_1112803 [Chytriomyces sp. MP71]|nr:hypothetical protein BC830DRAFT_1112803 [Chytriomyces sp. MP71]
MLLRISALALVVASASFSAGAGAACRHRNQAGTILLSRSMNLVRHYDVCRVTTACKPCGVMVLGCRHVVERSTEFSIIAASESMSIPFCDQALFYNHHNYVVFLAPSIPQQPP